MTTSLVAAVMLAAAIVIAFVVMGREWRRRRVDLEARAAASLADLFVFVDPRNVIIGSIVAAALASSIAWLVTGTPLAAIAVAAATGTAPRIVLRRYRERRHRRLIEQLPDALTLLASSLRAGAGLQVALDMAAKESPAPLSQELALVLRAQRVGQTLNAALAAMAERIVREETDLLVCAVTLAKDVGGNLAEILDRLAATLRTQRALEAKIDAMTAQGKLQGVIVGALPLLLAVALFWIDPDAMQPLVDTTGGWLVIAAVVVLEVTGALMIRKIVTIDP